MEDLRQRAADKMLGRTASDNGSRASRDLARLADLADEAALLEADQRAFEAMRADGEALVAYQIRAAGSGRHVADLAEGHLPDGVPRPAVFWAELQASRRERPAYFGELIAAYNADSRLRGAKVRIDEHLHSLAEQINRLKSKPATTARAMEEVQTELRKLEAQRKKLRDLIAAGDEAIAAANDRGDLSVLHLMTDTTSTSRLSAMLGGRDSAA
ncbi:MAG: peptidoglycan bridge formation glycyltransferase FemA/FemB family protein [Myxococcales bacterium]|nr:peptidoglycan bridge formation glycyltransferase FemA/FemB family protein [Myxococcales bacterium]